MEKKAWPYVAGMLDAEGTFQIAVDRRPNGITGMSLQITISNTDIRLMKWLSSNFGGKFYRRKNQRGFSTKDSPDIYFWFMFGKQNQEAFLLGVLPHIVAKKQEAVLALEFVRMTGWNKDRKLQIAEEMKAAKVGDLEKDRKENLVKLTPSEMSAFAAGVFDGDGSIGQSVELTQKRLILMRWFLMCFGGRFDQRSMNGGKTYFRWRLSGKKNKKEFLLDLVPHLLLKKEQAKNLLNSIEKGSATTDMLSTPPGVKTQSELTGDSKSDSTKT
ncbi:LAGLIDADG endonuclease [uncultured archaeon]|nr:LAGLIDADG endonuclease [uncultured archaeon]